MWAWIMAALSDVTAPTLVCRFIGVYTTSIVLSLKKDSGAAPADVQEYFAYAERCQFK